MLREIVLFSAEVTRILCVDMIKSCKSSQHTEPSPVLAAFNGVTAEILDVYGIIPSAGLSVTYYTSVGDGWTYGKANIEWKTNHYKNLLPARSQGELVV